MKGSGLQWRGGRHRLLLHLPFLLTSLLLCPLPLPPFYSPPSTLHSPCSLLFLQLQLYLIFLLHLLIATQRLLTVLVLTRSIISLLSLFFFVVFIFLLHHFHLWKWYPAVGLLLLVVTQPSFSEAIILLCFTLTAAEQLHFGFCLFGLLFIHWSIYSFIFAVCYGHTGVRSFVGSHTHKQTRVCGTASINKHTRSQSYSRFSVSHWGRLCNWVNLLHSTTKRERERGTKRESEGDFKIFTSLLGV